jgi:hypothetical protein
MPVFPGPSSAIIDGDFKLIAWHDGRREIDEEIRFHTDGGTNN